MVIFNFFGTSIGALKSFTIKEKLPIKLNRVERVVPRNN